ncbi:MAG: hypothetical protein ABEH43_05315, partial [Flavobacteriales bacterium]
MKGTNNITVLSVNHQNNYSKKPEKSDMMKKLEKKRKDLQFKYDVRENMEFVYGQEKSVILENKNIKGEKTGVNVEDLMELAIYYRKRLKEIENKLLEIENDKKELQKKIRRVKKEIKELRKQKKKGYGEIKVKINSPKTQPSNIKVTYLTQKAKWTPAYDINANEAGKPIQ